MADGNRVIHATIRRWYAQDIDHRTEHFKDVYRVIVENGVMKMWYEDDQHLRYTELTIDQYERIWWD